MSGRIRWKYEYDENLEISMLTKHRIFKKKSQKITTEEHMYDISTKF